jgi:hypothetical protein
MSLFQDLIIVYSPQCRKPRQEIIHTEFLREFITGYRQKFSVSSYNGLPIIVIKVKYFVQFLYYYLPFF